MAENKWSILEAVNESNNLRASGDEFGYYYKDGMMHIGDPLVFNQPDYSQLNEAIVRQGEKNTAEIKELMGNAQYIDKPPAWSRQSVRSNIFTFLNNFGINPEKSNFIAEMLAGDPSKELGALDLAGLMAIPEMVEGSREFRAGLKEGDALTMGMGGLRTGFGLVESAPYIGMAFKTLKQPVKDTIKLLGNKAREYKANQPPGTKLLSTDPTDPTVDAIIKLDEMVNSPVDEDQFLKTQIEKISPEYKNEIKEIALARNPNVKDPNNPKILTEDLHKFYDNLAIKKHGRKLSLSNPEDYQIIKNENVQSIKQQLKNEVSGKGWYDEDVLKMFNMLSKTPGFEKLGTSETHRVIFSAILGATSPGPKVAQNTKAGVAQYLKWARTGKFSTEAPPPGTAIEDIQSAGFGQYGYPDGLKMIQHLLDKFGEERFADFLLSPKTKKELTALRLEAGFKSGPAGMSGKGDSLHLGMAILGDKAGKFALNINGFPTTTKDKWFVRTIRRSEGTFMDHLVPKIDKKKGTKKMVELGQPKNQSERLLMDQLVKDIINDPELKELNLTEQDAQAILWFREQTLQNDLGVPTKPETFSEGVEKVNEQEGFGIFASDADKVAIEQGTVKPTGFREFSARQRAVRENRRIQRLNNPEGDAKTSGPYQGEGTGDVGLSGGVTFEPNPEVLARYNKAGLNIPIVTKVDASTSAKAYSDDMSREMANHPLGPQVTIQNPDNLQDAKLYRTEFGGGFAIKPDGDVIGVFQGANAPPKTIYATLQLAIEQGGKKLDAFNTMLPDIYETVGFRPVSRVKWNDAYAPEGWNKETFGEYNNGEPDLVLFVYDKDYFGGVDIDDLPIFTSYDEAQKIQNQALKDLGGDDVR